MYRSSPSFSVLFLPSLTSKGSIPSSIIMSSFLHPELLSRPFPPALSNFVFGVFATCPPDDLGIYYPLFTSNSKILLKKQFSNHPPSTRTRVKLSQFTIVIHATRTTAEYREMSWFMYLIPVLRVISAFFTLYSHRLLTSGFQIPWVYFCSLHLVSMLQNHRELPNESWLTNF